MMPIEDKCENGLVYGDEQRAAPLSDFLGIPTIWRRPSKLRLWDMKIELSFGFLLLSAKQTPLSSLLRLPVKSGRSGKKSSFGLPLLSSKATPLSSMFRLPVLTRSKRR